MNNKSKEALHYELKFINMKIAEIRNRMSFIAQRHQELQDDLDDMSRHYERTAELLDDLEHPRIKQTSDGIPLIQGSMKQELVAEYGSVGNVKFPDAKNVKLYDGEGKIMNCQCGKPAAMMMAGKESYLLKCQECWEK